jgi:hypothetical protein
MASSTEVIIPDMPMSEPMAAQESTDSTDWLTEGSEDPADAMPEVAQTEAPASEPMAVESTPAEPMAVESAPVESAPAQSAPVESLPMDQSAEAAMSEGAAVVEQLVKSAVTAEESPEASAPSATESIATETPVAPVESPAAQPEASDSVSASVPSDEIQSQSREAMLDAAATLDAASSYIRGVAEILRAMGNASSAGQ